MASEFNIATEDLIKIGVAFLCGAMLGFERQYKNKTAGFRTIIVICLGSALFTMVAQKSGLLSNMNIVTGIGFIGAGVIFKDGFSVNGLTTAAVIWISAAIGMVVGAGSYSLALISTVLTLIVLILFHLLEDYVDKVHHEKILSVVLEGTDNEDLEMLKDLIEKLGLKAQVWFVGKKDGCIQATIAVTGHKKNINKLDEKLLKMPQVKAF
ncbi:MAG: MgtC/SapB family protein [Bacteroidetes bacterium]|nr:MgtC/SapB family protein [Bacteroidota bacterium]